MHKQRHIQMNREYYYIIVGTKYYYNRIQYLRKPRESRARTNPPKTAKIATA